MSHSRKFELFERLCSFKMCTKSWLIMMSTRIAIYESNVILMDSKYCTFHFKFTLFKFLPRLLAFGKNHIGKFGLFKTSLPSIPAKISCSLKFAPMKICTNKVSEIICTKNTKQIMLCTKYISYSKSAVLSETIPDKIVSFSIFHMSTNVEYKTPSQIS